MSPEQEQLVVTHLPYVRGLVFRSCGRFDEDAIQDASIALMSAAARFDPDTGYKFWTYAQHVVGGQITSYFRRQVGSRAISVRATSLDSFLEGPAGSGESGAYDAFANIESTEETVEASIMTEVGLLSIESHLAKAPSRTKDIIARRRAGEHLAAIAKVHGCSESRVSQIVTKFVGDMRKATVIAAADRALTVGAAAHPCG